MNTPEDFSTAPNGPELVEPENQGIAPDLESLDTDRILRDTGSIVIPPALEDTTPEHTDVAPPSETLAEESEPEELSMADEESKQDLDTPSEPERSGINIVSIVALILALTLSPFSVIFGYLAVGQIRRSEQRGEALAWFSVGLGWLWLVGYVLAGSIAITAWLQL